jgi:polyisoprenoid-binding protein YceI
MKRKTKFFIAFLLLIIIALGALSYILAKGQQRMRDSIAQLSPKDTSSLDDAEPNRLLPLKLREIPTGLLAQHDPNPVFAVYENNRYIWKHNTTVQAISEDLQLVEYGSYIYTDKGWMLRVTLTPKDFEAAYNCKDGLLKKGITYTDPKSWRQQETLSGGDALWFYIVKNAKGQLFKGTALVETEGKLQETSDTITSKSLPAAKTDTGKAISAAPAVMSATANTAATSISWTGYGETGSYSLTGDVKLKSGRVTYAGNKLLAGTMVIDLTTMNHKTEDLVNHLKGEDFFDVAKYPTAQLSIQKSDSTGINQLKVTAALTIKNITKNISFPVSFKKENGRLRFTGKVKVDRTKFGIQFGSNSFFDNLGDQAIKNEFDINFDMITK